MRDCLPAITPKVAVSTARHQPAAKTGHRWTWAPTAVSATHEANAAQTMNTQVDGRAICPPYQPARQPHLAMVCGYSTATVIKDLPGAGGIREFRQLMEG